MEYIRAEDLKRDVVEFIHPKYRPIAIERMKKVLSGEEVEPKEEVFVLPDGREIHFETKPSLVRFRNEKAVLLILRDVTEKVKRRKQLRESAEKYWKIVNNSPNLIAILTEEGVFVEANPSMVKSLGTNPIGKSTSEIIGGEVAERRLSFAKKVIDTNEGITFQDEREGKHFINHYVPIEIGGKRHCLVIAKDITELVILNKLLKNVAEVNKAIARIRNREELIKKVEEILSDYSARISEKPEDIYFPITYGGDNFGYLCVERVNREEKILFERLSEDLALAFKSLEDEKIKNELYNMLYENILIIMYLVDRIRNPLAALRAFAELLIENSDSRQKIIEQVDRITEIIRTLDSLWERSERKMKNR
nr:PAS domain S-box protein [Archaeoglobus neptunius]